MAALSIQKISQSASVSTSGTYSDSFDITNHKFVSFQAQKSGAGTGVAKLQKSNDGTVWADVNTTVYPTATQTISAGAQNIFLEAECCASMIRVLFTEAGTNTATIASGKWIAKLH